MVHSLRIDLSALPFLQLYVHSILPFDFGGVRTKCSYASSPCLNRLRASLFGDSNDSLKSRAVQSRSQHEAPLVQTSQGMDLHSKSLQKCEYSAFSLESSSTTSTRSPTALLAWTKPMTDDRRTTRDP